MLKDAWDMRLALAKGEWTALDQQIRDADRQIHSLLDRLVEATSASVVSAYEARIEKLERDKIVLAEKRDKTTPPAGGLEGWRAGGLEGWRSVWNSP